MLPPLAAEMILGSRIYFVGIGASIGGEDAGLKVSDTTIPELPESYESPGDWTCLGKIRTSKPQTDFKTSEAEGVDDSGVYKVTEMKIATKRKIQFSTNDITPMAWQLTFGLLNPLKDGETQRVFASGNDSREGWLCVDMTDAYRAETGLARYVVRVKLSLQNPLEAKSDPAQADYEAVIVANALSNWETLKLTTAE